MKIDLKEIYDLLYDTLGPQYWWPARSPFEVIVGAVLVQNTNWQNVARAIEALHTEDLLTPQKIAALDMEKLETLIRPAGYYRVKARRLREVVNWLIETCDGQLDKLFRRPTDDLRKQLLAVHGVGPETADSILLYAGDLPVFVVDAYTVRIFTRHGWIDDSSIAYHTLQEQIEASLPRDTQLFNEFHALIVWIGKTHCKRRSPRCEDCPLKTKLPNGGPIEI